MLFQLSYSATVELVAGALTHLQVSAGLELGPRFLSLLDVHGDDERLGSGGIVVEGIGRRRERGEVAGATGLLIYFSVKRLN